MLAIVAITGILSVAVSSFAAGTEYLRLNGRMKLENRRG
jgi:hypothetical protein